MDDTNYCLSIRQPWAWMIANGYNDIENRTWRTEFRGACFIHAGKTMTRMDYEAAMIFIGGIWGDPGFGTKFIMPAFENLKQQCGGIVGQVEIVDCVAESVSPWFCGPFGFVLRNAKPLPFAPCNGRLGFYRTALSRGPSRTGHAATTIQP